MIHSILVIGQSNAGGRGFVSEVEPIENADESIKVLRNGRWIPPSIPTEKPRA